jgi:hypothetical protein
MVIKFTPEGRVAMVFGRKQEASDEETGPLKHPNPPLPSEPGRLSQTWRSSSHQMRRASLLGGVNAN